MRRITRKDRPYRGCRGWRTRITSIKDSVTFRPATRADVQLHNGTTLSAGFDALDPRRQPLERRALSSLKARLS
jgi:hypothetical protein